MAVVLLAMGLCVLLLQGCGCSSGLMNKGCLKWRMSGDDVCCDICHPGHRLIRECGPKPKDLCTPCEPGKFAADPKSGTCEICTQCVGAQVLLKECTPTRDTQCDCREGLTCNDDRCSFCVQKCEIGQEPTENRYCRPCPDGTFNDHIHQKCKPWSTRCPNPDEKIVTKGNASSDIKCVQVSPPSPVTTRKKSADDASVHKDPMEPVWPVALAVVPAVVLLTIGIIFSVIIVKSGKKILQKRNEIKKPIPKSPIIRTPTDDPRTLIAIECSFHEAEQEQGSSSESLNSKDSSDQLIA